MYIRWTSFKCPHCGKTWDARVVSAPRPDKEVRLCSGCDQQFRTHDIEWQHMTAKQKAGYLFNEWMIAWLLFYAMIVAVSLGMLDRARTAADYLNGAVVFLIVTSVMLGPFALTKWLRIRRSKRRTMENVLA